MDGLLRPVWQTKDATPPIDSQHQAGNYGEEMGGGASPVQEEDRQEEVRYAEQSAKSNGGPSAEATGSALPPNQNRALPHGPIPAGRRTWTKRNAGGANTRHRPESICSSTASKWKPQQKLQWAEVRKETGRGKDRFTIRDLLADE